MPRLRFLIIFFFSTLILWISLQAHEGHHLPSLFAEESDFFTQDAVSPHAASWLGSIGRFHFLFLHFPIALIVMTVVAEWLWIWFANPLFSHAARFMILSAAIFALPTALLGFALSYEQNYTGISLDLYVWHRYFGFLTAGLAILAAILRERYNRELSASLSSYYVCLFLLFLSVSLTGAFGGGLTFGLEAIFLS